MNGLLTTHGKPAGWRVQSQPGEFRPAGTRLLKPLSSTALALLLSSCAAVPEVGPPQGDCAADDPRIGRTAELENTFIHGIQGTARIVSNCTIVIENFFYDGIGFDVRIVGVKDGDFANPTVLSPGNLVRAGGYTDQTLTVTLPEGVTLDDVPTISVMCVPFRFSFGAGTFSESSPGR